MGKSDYYEAEGKVTSLVPGGKFLVELENGVEITGHLSGKMRLNKINVLINDRVTVDISTYDLSQGRITYRFK